MDKMGQPMYEKKTGKLVPKQARYGFEKARATRCKTHILPDMKDVTHPRCTITGCEKRAKYMNKWCSRHFHDAEGVAKQLLVLHGDQGPIAKIAKPERRPRPTPRAQQPRQQQSRVQLRDSAAEATAAAEAVTFLAATSTSSQASTATSSSDDDSPQRPLLGSSLRCSCKRPNLLSSCPKKFCELGCVCTANSSCLKKYCECWLLYAFCSANCACISCQNFPGSTALDDSRSCKRRAGSKIGGGEDTTVAASQDPDITKLLGGLRYEATGRLKYGEICPVPSDASIQLLLYPLDALAAKACVVTADSSSSGTQTEAAKRELERMGAIVNCRQSLSSAWQLARIIEIRGDHVLMRWDAGDGSSDSSATFLVPFTSEHVADLEKSRKRSMEAIGSASVDEEHRKSVKRQSASPEADGEQQRVDGPLVVEAAASATSDVVTSLMDLVKEEIMLVI